jgi:hypothetical protein
MSETNSGYTRRGFLAVGGAVVGAAALGEVAFARGDHPKLLAAITGLEEARVYLRSSRHDFGGHRTEALEHIDRAIRQLRICLEY